MNALRLRSGRALRLRPGHACFLSVATFAAALAASPLDGLPQAPVRPPDVRWVPTRDEVVDGMLKLAKVSSADVVYDLGCGDGKIVIAAARQYGARGVGVDIDPERIKEANENAKAAGVTDKVTFILGDIFDPNIKIGEATVVTLFLLPRLNLLLRPRLWKELRPGTRVVSNSFDMGDWTPARTEQFGNFTVYFWTIPQR
jgi:SAM-dependent methyltransferase